MLKAFLSLLMLTTLVLSSEKDIEKAKRTKEAIQKAIQKEELYAKEQVFYDYDSYDFKDSEVNEESIPALNEIEVNDLDMDDVYD